ncbi:hypothetical protein [Streptomyces olivaceoviridis]|uniref:hypothetical protein n=1 Tax=Streptomyces olivaceoviridis TaxID=1921 RepID=UPI0037AB7CE9
MRYPAARLTFTWAAGRGGRLVAMDGTPVHTTDSGRPAPPTVVVRRARQSRAVHRDDRLRAG